MDRLKLPGFALLGLLAMSVALPAMAANTWAVAGTLPPGGFVRRLAINPVTPSTLYAAAQTGLYKSTDSGASWTRIFKTANPPNDVAIDPQNPNTLYMVSVDTGGAIYKTTNGGVTWIAIHNGILGVGTTFTIDYLQSVAVDPVDEGVIYVGANNTGVYKSTDGGAHWVQSNTGIVTSSTKWAEAVHLVVDPVTPAVVYAFVISYDGSSYATTLYKSVDGAATWTIISSTPYFDYPEDVKIDPADHTHLITCFQNSVNQSMDSGATWKALFTATTAGVCAFDPSDSSHVLVGSETSLYVSSSGGPFAAAGGVPSDGISDIAFDPVAPSNIYVASSAWAVLKSSDGGSSWSQSNVGIPNLLADRLLEGSDGILYMSTAQAGIFKSLDQGATWTVAGSSSFGSLPNEADGVAAFAQDPTVPAKLYAGTSKGVYRSSDGGNSWTASDTGMPAGASAASLALDPEAPATLYAGLEWWTSSANAGVYKSVDGGATWTASSSGLTISFPRVNGIAVDPHNSSVVYAAPYGVGLFKSVDGGATWTESDTGMGQVNIWSLAVDPTDSNKVYAAAVQGLYKSNDGGTTWAMSSNGLPGSQLFDAVLIDPVDPSIIYLSSPSLGLSYMSVDGAASWQPLNSGTLAAASVSLGATLIDPVNHSHIYAAGTDGKLHVLGSPAPAAANNGKLGTTPETSVSGALSASTTYTGIQTPSFSVVQQPGHGLVRLDAATGKFTYTPAGGYLGADSFSFKVTEQFVGVSNVATESFSIADIAPTANAGSAHTAPNTTIGGTLSVTRSFMAQVLSFKLISKPVHGTVSVDPTSWKFSYTPAKDFAGMDSFTFQVSDQFGGVSKLATEQLTVADLAATAIGANISAPGAQYRGTLVADKAYPQQILTFTLVGGPRHGTVTLNAQTGAFIYWTSKSFHGTDSFTFRAVDQLGTPSNIGIVTITVL